MDGQRDGWTSGGMDLTGRRGLGDGASREWVEEGQVGGCMGK